MAGEQRAFGTQLLVNGQSITRLTSINGLNVTADTMEILAHDNATDYKEFLTTFKDGGEASLSGYYNVSDELGQGALLDTLNAGDVVACSIVFPQGGGWNFNGVVTAFSTDAPVEDTVNFEATIKVSGKPTLLVNASTGLTGLVLTGTGGTLAPAFNAGIQLYTFAGVTAANIKVKATAAAHALKLFKNGQFIADLTSGQDSADIALTVGSHSFKVVAAEDGKAPKVYEVVVVKAS